MTEQEVAPMRDEFPRWYRQVEMGDNREKLELRWKGVIDLVDNADSESIVTMIAIALRTKPRPQATQVAAMRQTFKDIDDLFDMAGNDRELEILCSSALAMLFEGDEDTSALAALFTTTASCGGQRTADFALDLVGTANAALARISDDRRTRPALGKMVVAAPLKISVEQENTSLKQAFNADQVAAAFTALCKQTESAMQRLTRNLNAVLKEAHTFGEIQDEELQMLWWLFGGRSKKMDCPFSEISPEAQTFILAAELADITKFLPGPDSVKPILSRAGLKERKKYSVPAAVNACDPSLLNSLIDGMEPSQITQPLHFAIKRKLETGDDASWIPAWSSISGIDATFSLPAIELGNLFYRERLGVLLGGE
ncbi:GTPase-associated system all-helical protein GASH [Tardiphaga sp. 285_C5_N1_2]|uniref:GTPase-associated system all-helical protein GASH n=1 Tax=Tardiphaga sp. 285_C5_N1_2 TaxID=3240775 RepID=UPI003F8AA7A6